MHNEHGCLQQGENKQKPSHFAERTSVLRVTFPSSFVLEFKFDHFFIAFRLLRIPVLGRYGVLCKSVKHFNKSSLEIPVRQHVKTRNQITELSRGLPCCWRALRRTILGAVFVNITLHNLNPQWGSVLLRYWPYYRYLMHQYSQSKTNKPYKLFFTGTFRLAVLTSLAADHLSGPPGSPVPRLPHCIISQR